MHLVPESSTGGMSFKTSQLSRQTETPQEKSENEKSSLTQSERAISTLLAVGE